MSKSRGQPPEIAASILRLPQDFLNIDHLRRELSVGRRRSMADLVRGRDGLNESFVISSLVAGGLRSWEDPDAVRHVHRGAALTWLLLEDSAPNFPPDSGKHFMNLVDLEPKPNPARELFKAAKDDLMEARRSAMLAETWRLPEQEAEHNLEVYKDQVTGVLIRAGIHGFPTAVHELKGSGLEERTQYNHASYGSALVALAIGMTESPAL